MCKPVLPLVQDKIAHIFWEAKHITKVHNHHGDQHTQHEIASASQQESNKNPSNSKISEPVSLHIIVQSSQSIPQLFDDKMEFGTIIYNPTSLYLNKQYPPPRFC